MMLARDMKICFGTCADITLSSGGGGGGGEGEGRPLTL